MPLFAEQEDDVGKVALGRRIDDVGGARPSPLMRMSSGPSLPEGEAALGLVELHRRDAEVEHHAVDRVMAAARAQRVEIGEPVLHQRQPAARLSTSSAPAAIALGSRSMRDDAAVGGRRMRGL